MEAGLRLNRFLAAAGLGSRRSCEEHILKGRISINGSVARNLSTRVLAGDDVRISGRIIHAIAPRTILLNKPAGYVTTRSDRHAARTIFELLPSDAGHLFHVGRLDKESEGLLLLTNDGALAQELMHPSKGVDKEYEVILDKTFHERDATALKKGTWIDGSVARIVSVRQLAPNKIQLVLHQGLKRQIRIMLGQIGFNVQRLTRTRIGPITLRGVKLGSYRDLRPEDLEALQKALAAPRPPKLKKVIKPRPRLSLLLAKDQATRSLEETAKKTETSTQKIALKKESSSFSKPRGRILDDSHKKSPQLSVRKTSPTSTRTRKAI
jgi:23S rRNA pseudouridine2605 synthase